MRALLAALVLLPCAAQAQQPPQTQQTGCMPWPQLMMELKTKYKEVAIGGGQMNADTVVTLFASPAGATFTVVLIRRDGMACAIAGGKELDIGNFPPAGEPT